MSMNRFGCLLLVTSCLLSCSDDDQSIPANDGGKTDSTARDGQAISDGSHDQQRSDAKADSSSVADTNADAPVLTCTELEDGYSAAILEAKKCNSRASTSPCTKTMAGDLICGCPTFVNPANTAVVQQLESFQTAWADKKCYESGPICDCMPPPDGASCLNGSCDDYYNE